MTASKARLLNWLTGGLILRFAVVTFVFIGVAALSSTPTARPALLIVILAVAIEFNRYKVHAGWSLYGAATSLTLAEVARHFDATDFAVSTRTAAASFLAIWLLQAALTEPLLHKLYQLRRLGIARVAGLQIGPLLVLAAGRVSSAAFIVAVAGTGLMFTKLKVSVEGALSTAAIVAFVAALVRLSSHAPLAHDISITALGVLGAGVAPALHTWRAGAVERWTVASLFFFISHGVGQSGQGRTAIVFSVYFLGLGLMVTWRTRWQPWTSCGLTLFTAAAVFVVVGASSAAITFGQVAFFCIFAGSALCLFGVATGEEEI